MVRTATTGIVMSLAVLCALLMAPLSTAVAGEIDGVYLETRTCQVYTGPCFANAEIGLTGKDAIMAWGIQRGDHKGVQLDGLHVVVVVNASDTLAFYGMEDPKHVRSVIYVDQRATDRQREALVDFARTHSGRAGDAVVRVESKPIEMSLDIGELKGQLKAGKSVKLLTRKAGLADCICSNESAYYPPLAKVKNFVPGVTIEGEFRGRGLGTRWSTPGSRSAYMATFSYQ